jgi:hypothetical protein
VAIHRLLPNAVFYNKRTVMELKSLWLPDGALATRSGPSFWYSYRPVIRQTADFRTHWKFAKRVYFAFRPLWWALHVWDWAIADRWVPAWSCGFDILVAYPEPTPELVACDGVCGQSGTNVTWATLGGGLGDYTEFGQGDYPNIYVAYTADSTTDRWSNLWRFFCLFDTSSLPDSITVISAVLSLSSRGKTDGLSSAPSLNVYSASPLTNVALGTGDFDAVGSTAFATAVAYADVPASGTYFDFTFNLAGRNSVSKTGVSKYSVRASYDATNTAPPWVSGQSTIIYVDSAEATAVSADPRLVVTATDVPSAGTYDEFELITYPAKKSTAFTFKFPIRDSTKNLISGASGLDSEYVSWDVGDTPGAFADCTNEASEVDSEGWYKLAAVSGELAKDYSLFRIKSTEGVTQHVLIVTNILALLGTPAGASLSADVASVASSVAALPTSSQIAAACAAKQLKAILKDVTPGMLTAYREDGTMAWEEPYTTESRSPFKNIGEAP